MNRPARVCRCPDLIVQVVHRGTRDLPSNAGSVVRFPLAGYRGDGTDLVQTSVDAVNKVRPVPTQHEVRILGAQILLGRPGNDPCQVVPLYV